jgi:WD40 repeat protein
MAHARALPTAIVLESGMVFVIGGDEAAYDQTGQVPSAEIFDPATGTFAPAGTMQAGHHYAAVALLHDGRVLVAGGHDGRNYVRSAEIYDPATGTFSPTGAPLSDRQSGVAVTLSDGRVLIAGGSAVGSNSTAELYDPSTGKFSRTGSLTTNRFYGPPTATLLTDGRVLLAGGGGNDGVGGLGGGVASAEIYDPKTGKFTATGSMTAPRYGHTATLLPSGLVLIVGGYTGDDSSLSSAELYDPKTGKFSASGSMRRPRGQHAASSLPDGRILITGGYDMTRRTDGSGAVTELVLSSTDLYDPATGLFTEGAAMTMARYQHAAVSLKDGSVLVLGGSGGSGDEVSGEEATMLATAELATP